MNKILLYYIYTKIKDPKQLCNQQRKLCERLGLRGRILIAEEGLNGTVAGPENSIDEYMRETNSIEGLENLEWKIAYDERDIDQLFPKLRVVVRDEIVTLGVRKSGKDVDINNRAEYIEPKELKKKFDNHDDFVIIDARSDYETNVGRFKDSIVVDLPAFRYWPEYLEKIDNLKDKEVVTVCTGGVKCEKFSALLKENGFKNVKQLHGGIHRYGVEAGGENFEGEMYVFDGRVNVPVNNVNPKVISKCRHCGKEVARYINCHSTKCNRQFICCNDCEFEFGSTCSSECKKLIEDHPEFIAYTKVEVKACGM